MSFHTRVALLACLCFIGCKHNIEGAAFLDANNNGAWDATERPIANVTVSLDPSMSGPTRQQATNADGKYRFEELSPGEYALSQSVGPNMAATAAIAGSLFGGTSTDKVHITGIVIPKSNKSLTGTGYDFGQRRLPPVPELCYLPIDGKFPAVQTAHGSNVFKIRFCPTRLANPGAIRDVTVLFDTDELQVHKREPNDALKPDYLEFLDDAGAVILRQKIFATTIEQYPNQEHDTRMNQDDENEKFWFRESDPLLARVREALADGEMVIRVVPSPTDSYTVAREVVVSIR